MEPLPPGGHHLASCPGSGSLLSSQGPGASPNRGGWPAHFPAASPSHGQTRLCPGDPPRAAGDPGPTVPCPAEKGAQRPSVHIGLQAEWICSAASFQNETRNQVSSSELDKDSPSAREADRAALVTGRLCPPRTGLARSRGTTLAAPRGGAGQPISWGHRLGKTIPDVANKKSKVHQTSRDRLLARPLHRCSGL